MHSFSVPAREQVSANNQAIFDKRRAPLGEPAFDSPGLLFNDHNRSLRKRTHTHPHQVQALGWALHSDVFLI